MIKTLYFWGTITGLMVVNYAIISVLEHLIHRYLMHKKILPQWVYSFFPYFREVFYAHALRHHGKWYKMFNFESDPIGKEENLKILLVDTAVILIVTAPIIGVWMLVSPLGGCIYILMVFVHNRLWSILHRQMHIPSNVFFKDWAVYKYLARYHFLHHQKVNQNFNVVFPFADFCFGCVAHPRLQDIRTMMVLGLLHPKGKQRRFHSEA